jgi:hypothetical protein
MFNNHSSADLGQSLPDYSNPWIGSRKARRSIFSGLLILMMGLQGISATTYTFTGNTDNMIEDPPMGTGVWNNPMHWDPDTGFPGASDNASLTGGRTLNLSGSLSVLNFSQASGFLGGSGTLEVVDEWKTSAGTSLMDSSKIKALDRATLFEQLTLSDISKVELLGDTAVLDGTTIIINDNASILNNGRMTFNGDAAISSNVVNGVFDNRGTMEGISGVVTVGQLNFINSGFIDGEGGVIQFLGDTVQNAKVEWRKLGEGNSAQNSDIYCRA